MLWEKGVGASKPSFQENFARVEWCGACFGFAMSDLVPSVSASYDETYESTRNLESGFVMGYMYMKRQDDQTTAASRMMLLRGVLVFFSGERLVSRLSPP